MSRNVMFSNMTTKELAKLTERSHDLPRHVLVEMVLELAKRIDALHHSLDTAIEMADKALEIGSSHHEAAPPRGYQMHLVYSNNERR